MRTKYILLFFALLTFPQLFAQKPRLVINIVVGSMRAEDLERYKANFQMSGLQRLMLDGTYYTNSRYNCLQTTTPVSLATLSTGAMPSTHGIIGNQWVNYTDNQIVTLIDEREPDARNIIAPTLSETVVRQSPSAKVVTAACDATSAFILSGRRGGDIYWLDNKCAWQGRSLTGRPLPKWVEKNNREEHNLSYINEGWSTLIDCKKYINKRSFDIALTDFAAKRRGKAEIKGQQRLALKTDLDKLRYTPAGNSLLFGFAKQAIIQYELGTDQTPDVLNLCLDASRYITQAYGPESVEVEDMYYRLDAEISDFLRFLALQPFAKETVIVFTSAHGTSPSYDVADAERRRFNPRQFEVIVNGFLNVRYGTGDWVVAYDSKCLWLNHNLIYQRGMSLAQVQNEVATFAMQFSGVSHALSASAMRNSYFGSGYAQKMQNSFYPQRSGDVLINLMPEWIEEQYRCASSSGSMYGYDTQVPLIFYGEALPRTRINRTVEQTAVAPTLAHILGVTEPAASEGTVLDELINF